jgi:hypothetical protein
MKLPFASFALASCCSCAYLPQPGGEFVNTPYISRTVGVGVVHEGELELEGLADVDPGEKAKSTVKVNAGLGPGFEFALGWGPYYSSGSGPDSHGVGDVVVTAKYQFADGSRGALHGIVEAESRLPTSDTGPAGRDGETDFIFATSVGQAFGAYSLIGTYELGLLGAPGLQGPAVEHGGVLAASFRMSPSTRGFTELSVVHEPQASVTQWYAGGGAGITVADGLELQGALQFGLDEDTPDYRVVVGFSYELGPALPILR